MKRNIITSSLFLALFFLLQISKSGASKAAADNADIVLGGAFALSGIAAGYGVAELNGTLLAIEEANASGGIGRRKLRLVAEDTLSSNVGTVNAVQKLINIDQAPAILGPTWGDTFSSGVPIAERQKIPLLMSSVSITALNHTGHHDFVFSTRHRSDLQARFLAYELKQTGVQDVAIVTEEDPFWQDFHASFAQEAEGCGLVLRHNITLAPAPSEFRPMLLRITAGKPVTLVFGVNSDASWLSFLKQKSELRPELSVYSIDPVDVYATNPDFKPYLKRVLSVVPLGADHAFSAKYHGRFGVLPEYGASNAYDAANMLIQALRAGATSGVEIKSYLKQHQFETRSFGNVRFDNLGGVSGGRFMLKSLSPHTSLNDRAEQQANR